MPLLTRALVGLSWGWYCGMVIVNVVRCSIPCPCPPGPSGVAAFLKGPAMVLYSSRCRSGVVFLLWCVFFVFVVLWLFFCYVVFFLFSVCVVVVVWFRSRGFLYTPLLWCVSGLPSFATVPLCNRLFKRSRAYYGWCLLILSYYSYSILVLVVFSPV